MSASEMQPRRTDRSARATQVVAAALQILEAEGFEVLTMRRLADDIGIRAPSLYKHFPDKAALESGMIEEAFAKLGTALFEALEGSGESDPAGVVGAVLRTYRRYGIEHPNLYRLSTSGTLDRSLLPEGLEEWAGSPFFVATGDPYRAQAMWAFAHGMVILEIDGRFPDTTDLDRTWSQGSAAFAATSA